MLQVRWGVGRPCDRPVEPLTLEMVPVWPGGLKVGFTDAWTVVMAAAAFRCGNLCTAHSSAATVDCGAVGAWRWARGGVVAVAMGIVVMSVESVYKLAEIRPLPKNPTLGL